MRHTVFILCLSTCLSTGWAAYALAEDTAPMTDTGSTNDSRYKILTYSESQVYPVHMRFGYQTNIVFAPQEEIQTISVGDRSVWQIIPSANRLFIRPMEEGAETNMTVLTNKHSYQFDLDSAAAGKTGSVIYVAKFIYPDDKLNNASLAKAAANQLLQAHPPGVPQPVSPPAPAPMTEAHVEPPPFINTPTTPTAPHPSGPPGFNYEYTYSGPDELAPLQVFDNGKSTYIKYRDMDQPLPNTYIVAKDGSESPTTYYVKDDMMVIDKVVGIIALKSGSGTIKIYNEMINP